MIFLVKLYGNVSEKPLVCILNKTNCRIGFICEKLRNLCSKKTP